jgi:MFS family permease
MILLMTGVFQICLTVGSVANLLLVDRLGRRKLLLGGLSLLTVLLAIFAACTKRYGATGSTGKSCVAEKRR